MENKHIDLSDGVKIYDENGVEASYTRNDKEITMRHEQPLINTMRRQYPKGTRIRLDYMYHEKTIPAGTEGSVISIDDMAQIHMK